MSELCLPDDLMILAETGRVSSADVANLKANIFPDGLSYRAQAETLFAIDLAAFEVCPEWRIFLNEIIARFVCADETRLESRSDWLKICLSRKGLVDSKSRFELILRVVELAPDRPGTIRALALRQVAEAVLNHAGPLARNDKANAGVILACDVARIEAILICGDAHTLSREEAAILLDLHNRSDQRRNARSWNDLFVSTMARHIEGSRIVNISRPKAVKDDALDEFEQLISASVEDIRSNAGDYIEPFRLQAPKTGLFGLPSNAEMLPQDVELHDNVHVLSRHRMAGMR